MNQEEQVNADEKACAERISYWLKKYGCDLQAVGEIRSGQVHMRVDIVKLPPEVLRQIKKAEKDGSDKPSIG